MCGIVASLSSTTVVPSLIEGLKRLEYRGYDSAGLSVVHQNTLHTVKTAGKVSALKALVDAAKEEQRLGSLGIAHTRWATHGRPTDLNAHPHLSSSIAVVHNGIIENHLSIRKMLQAKGYQFLSETDTEVIAHLIHHISTLKKDASLEDVVRLALKELTGAYGLCIIDSSQETPKLIGARNGSPLVLGVLSSDNSSDDCYNYMLASDTSALVGKSDQVVYLEDGDLVVCTPKGYKITHHGDYGHLKVDRELVLLEAKLEALQKGGYEHFMLKEIIEQHSVLKDCMRGRLMKLESPDKAGLEYQVKVSGIEELADHFISAKRIIFLACGTSYNSALILEYLIESLCQIPVEVEYASEFRYRSPPLSPEDDVAVAISQSGETLDTLESVKLCNKRGIKIFGIINVIGSSIARKCDAGLYLRVGGEIGVASTKAFTGQLIGGTLLALDIARRRNKFKSAKDYNEIAAGILDVPRVMQTLVEEANLNKIKEIASVFRYAQNFLYLGRGFNYPSALEGALKLKEISYIHAEGYPAAEMKHGPIALIDKLMPVIIIAPKLSEESGPNSNLLYEKTISAVEEVRARGGCVILLTTEDNVELDEKCEFVIKLPKVREELTPLIYAVPMQLLAYYIAKFRGCDIDQPRNLAKSVTVE